MYANHHTSAILVFLLSLSLAACTSITPAGLIAASQLDPVNSDARNIAVAVGVPETLRLTDGDAEFHISYVTQETTISETVPLRLEPRSGAELRLPDTDQTLYVARFSPLDADKISAAQARIKALKEAGQNGKGTLSVAVTGGCITEAPIDAVPVSTWLQTDPANGFVRLTRERDVLQTLPSDEAQAFIDRLEICN